MQSISLWGRFVFKPSHGHNFEKANEEKGLSGLGGLVKTGVAGSGLGSVPSHPGS